MSAIDVSIDLPLQERTLLIQKELGRLGIQPETVLNQDNLFEILDKKAGGRTFDRGIAIQLYDRIQKDSFGQFTANGFIQVYLEAEQVLRERIRQLDASIIEYERQKGEVIEKLEIVKKEEVTNAYGVMHGSKLSLTICDFHYISTIIPRFMYVTVTCDQVAFRSQVTEYSGRAVWNEEFDIDIMTGLGDVHLVVLGYNQPESPEILGEVKIPMGKLKDQQKHDEWVDLFDRNGHLVGGKLHLTFQWLFSRIKFLNDVARKWDDNIRMHWDDKIDSERDLKILYDLFPSLSDAYPKTEKKQMKQGPSATAHRVQLHKMLSPVRERLDKFQGEQDIQGSQDMELEWREIGVWGHAAYVTSIALFTLSLFVCFFKADFIDLVVGLAVLLGYSANRRFKGNADNLYKLFMGTLAAIMIDILWLIIFSKSWNEIMRGLELTPNLSNFVIVLKWFSLPIKMLLAIILHKFSKYIRSSEGRLANIQLHQVRFSTTQMKNY